MTNEHDDPDADPLWAELHTIEQRSLARMEPRFGTCPVCRQLASEAFRFGTIAWAACFTCWLRWPVGEHVLDPLDDPVVAYWHIQQLAEFDQLDEEHMKQQEPEMISPPATDPADLVSRATNSKPFELLTDARLRCFERAQQLEAEQQPAPIREPTPSELKSWSATRATEDPAQLARRESLDREFNGYGDTYIFPVDGQWLPGAECARRLRLGAPFIWFYRAAGQGEWVPKERRGVSS